MLGYSARVSFLSDLLPLYAGDGVVHVVVEVPRGSQIKLKYDPVLGAFLWSRAMPHGLRFPYDFGFLPRTYAEDNDAADALVYSEVSSYPGVVVPSRIIGALRVEQQRDGGPIKRNDRIVVVPVNEHRRAHISEVQQIPERERDEMIEFFRASLAMTGKNVTFRGWADAAEATELVDLAHRRFKTEPE